MLPGGIRPFTNPYQRFAEGITAQKTPEFLQEELAKQQLANFMSRQQAPYAGPMAQQELLKSQLGNQAAQYEMPISQFKGQYPGTSLPGMAGQLFSIDALRDAQRRAGGSANMAIGDQQQGLPGHVPYAAGQTQQLPLSENARNRSAQVSGYDPQDNQEFYNKLTNKQQANRTPAGEQSPSDLGGLLEGSIFANLEKTKLQNQAIQQRMSGQPFRSLPAAQKNQEIAQAKGFGYTGTEASKLFHDDYTLNDLAKAKGYGPDQSTWPLAKYPPTMPILTQQQRANVAISGLKSIDPIMTEWMAPYAKKFGGHSLKLTAQMLSSSTATDRDIGRFLAARNMQLEKAGLRARGAGALAGQHVLEDLASGALGKSKVLEELMTPNRYKEAQEATDELIQMMNRAENRTVNTYQNESYENEDRQQRVQEMSDQELEALAQ